MSTIARDLRRLPFDGDLSTSAAACASVAADFGGIHHRRPLAVLQPASVADVARAVTFARAANICVAARGRGHSTCGQAQCDGGIVVDMRRMNRAVRVGARWIEIEAGATWKHVLDATVPLKLMPPVLPDYLGLSVGGLISLGGIGYQTCRYGTVVDHVTRLTVVTGTGEVVDCSPNDHADLFRAVRGGLGQFGIVVQARLRLRPAPPFIRFSRYLYADLATLLRDLRGIATGGSRFDTVCAFGITNEAAILRDVMGPAGGRLWFAPWRRRLFILQVGRYSSTAAVRAPLVATESLNCLPDVHHTWTEPFAAFADRASGHLEYWKRSGLWEAPHPWLNVIVSGAAATAWLPTLVDSLDPFDPADGPIMIYPLPRRRTAPSLLQLPRADWLLRVDVLRSLRAHGERSVAAIMRANRLAYAACVALGGVQYPSAALDMRPGDWRRHFGRTWTTVEALRQRYDPDRILTPGQGIVTARRRPGSSAHGGEGHRRRTPRNVRR